MKNITLSVEDEQEEFLKNLSNYSGWVREAIDLKRGKTEKSVQELEVEIKEKQLELDKLENKFDEKINQLLKHKEILTVRELNELEEKKLEKIKENEEFMLKYSPILTQYPEIDNLPDFESSTLLPILDKIMKDGHRIGIFQIRKWLMLKQEKEKSNDSVIQQ